MKDQQDALKKQLCAKHGVHLIVVPFTQFYNIEHFCIPLPFGTTGKLSKLATLLEVAGYFSII